jgi:hypothetical protein
MAALYRSQRFFLRYQGRLHMLKNSRALLRRSVISASVPEQVHHPVG